VLAPEVPDLALRATIFSTLSREELGAALEQLDRLVRSPKEHKRARAKLYCLVARLVLANRGLVQELKDQTSQDGATRIAFQCSPYHQR